MNIGAFKKKKRIWDFACDTVDKNPPGDTEDVGFIPDKDNYNMIPLVRGIFKKKRIWVSMLY